MNNQESNTNGNLSVSESQTLQNMVLNFAKDYGKNILISLLPITAILYVVSQLYLKSYIDFIKLNGITYNVLVASNNVNLITLGFVSILLSFVFTFIIAPILLRFIYNKSKPFFIEIHNNHQRKIDVAICIYFLLVFLSVSIKENLTIIIWLYLSIPTIISFFIIWKNRNNINFDKGIDFVIGGTMTSCIIFLLFYPFIFLIQAIDNTNTNDRLAYIILFIAWLLFSIFYGLRITDNDKKHYFIDFVCTICFLFKIFVLSSNTFKVAIAEFIGLKDKEPYVYAISKKDFLEIKHNLDTHWHYYQDDTNGKENILLYAKRKSDSRVYLNAQIIFRNDKIAVICPPDYNIIKQKTEICFIANQEYLTPTTMTPIHIDNTSLFYEIKKVAKYKYETSNIENQK